MAVRKTDEGYLTYPEATFFRECIAEYAGCELDPDGSKWGLEPKKLYKVYRPLSEIKNKEFLESLNAKPLINDHTIIGNGFGMVKPEDKNCGGVLTEVRLVGNELKGRIDVWSTKMIDAIRSGKRELSLAYACTFKRQRGVFQGQAYDFVQSELKAGNHLALVDEARNGHECRVVDCAYICDSKFQLEHSEMNWNTISADELVAGLKACSDECKAKAKEFLNTPTEDEIKKLEEEKKAADEAAEAAKKAEAEKVEAEKKEAVDTAVAEAEKKAADEAAEVAKKAEEDKKTACDEAAKKAVEEYKKVIALAEDCKSKIGEVSLDGIATEQDLAVKVCALDSMPQNLKTIAQDQAVTALKGYLAGKGAISQKVTDGKSITKSSFADYMANR